MVGLGYALLVLLGILLLLFVVMLGMSVPDIARYLRIRKL
ncbi:MAG: DUF6893 family small protein [Egibacteraceae bacterium]